MSWNTQHCHPSVFSTVLRGRTLQWAERTDRWKLKRRITKDSDWKSASQFRLNQLIKEPSQIGCFLNGSFSTHCTDWNSSYRPLKVLCLSVIVARFLLLVFVKLSNWSDSSVIWWPVRAGSSTASTLHFFSTLHLFWFIYHLTADWSFNSATLKSGVPKLFSHWSNECTM